MKLPRIVVNGETFLVQEFVNGFKMKPGTVRFRPDYKTYTDGSAAFMGSPFANAAGAVVQVAPDGSFQVVAAACPAGGLQSAISGEMLGMELLGMVLARGLPESECPHEARSVHNVADCTAVIKTFRKAAAGRPADGFLFEGSYREPGLAFVHQVVEKVDAHVWEEDARRQGWHDDWRGNDLADHYAKAARPALDAPPEPWIKDRRRRKKLLASLLESLAPEQLWNDMCRTRPVVARGRALKEPKASSHKPVFSGTGWACSECGKAFRSYGASLGDACPGQLAAAREAHPSHSLHSAVFGSGGERLPLVFCSRCGAHGTSVTKNLTKVCPALGCTAAAVGRKHAFRKQASLVKRGLHPSRLNTPLLEVRPLLRRAPPRWRDAGAEGNANIGEHVEANAGRPAAAARLPPAAGAAASAVALQVGAGTPPPPKRNRVERVVDEDIPTELEECSFCDDRSHLTEVLGGSLLEQLLADEDEARLAAVSAEGRAARVLEGRTAGSCHIDVCLPPLAEAGDEDEDMLLVGLDEGF